MSTTHMPGGVCCGTACGSGLRQLLVVACAPSELAAVDEIQGARDERGLVGGEEADELRDLLGLAEAIDDLGRDERPLGGHRIRGGVGRDTTLRNIGGAHNKTTAQVALRWLLQQERVSAIPKATSEEHLGENLDVFDFELSNEEMDRISSLGH